ncbi:MAG: hypothetical protein M3220_09975, partial [Chloroflexota bacterium]|nr:hypothetical protein [Chloroflexota bacterium]
VGLFDESLVGRVDWDMFLRIAQYYPIIFADRILARFRYHSGRTTAPTSGVYVQVFTSRLKVLDKVYARPDVPPEALEIKQIAYRNAYIDVGLQWLSIGRRREAFNAFRQAILVSRDPLVTPLRIVYLYLLYNFLSKSQWGNRLVSNVIALRRRLQYCS